MNDANISSENKTALKIELDALKQDIMMSVDNQYDKQNLIELFIESRKFDHNLKDINAHFVIDSLK